MTRPVKHAVELITQETARINGEFKSKSCQRLGGAEVRAGCGKEKRKRRSGTRRLRRTRPFTETGSAVSCGCTPWEIRRPCRSVAPAAGRPSSLGPGLLAPPGSTVSCDCTPCPSSLGTGPPPLRLALLPPRGLRGKAGAGRLRPLVVRSCFQDLPR